MELFGMIIGITVFAFLGMLAILAFGCYVLTAWNLQAIGKQLGVSNSWLAWIPVAKDWVLGRIAEECEGDSDTKRPWGKALVLLSGVLYIACSALSMVYVFLGVTANLAENGSVAVGVIAVICMIFVYCVALMCQLLSMSIAACKAICIFKLFDFVVPEKALKYIIVSFAVPVAQPFLFIKCKKRLVEKAFAEQQTEASVEV